MVEERNIHTPLSGQQLEDYISSENQYNDFTVHKIDPDVVVKPPKLFVSQEPMKEEDTFWPGKKTLIPDYSRIEELDEFAVQAPDYLQEYPQKLVEYLIQPAGNDLERYRLLFRWQASKIITGRRSNPEATSPYQAIKSRKSSRIVTPAMIFQELCSLVDLPCKVVKGYMKDASHYPGTKKKFHWNSWNVINIGTTQYFCDPYEACERYDESEHGGKKLLQSHFDEMSFLAEPDGFTNVNLPYEGGVIGDHPGSKTVKSVDDWNKQVTRGLISNSLGTKLYTTDGIVTTTKNVANLKFRFAREVVLNHSLTEARSGKSYHNHVIQVVKYEDVEFFIRLPQTGKFIFSVYGKARNIQKNVSCKMSGLIAKYCIVGNGSQAHQPFPFTKGPHGFQTSAVMAGFDSINYPPIIETSECKIALELSRPVDGNIAFHLFHERRPELKIVDMVYIEPFPSKFAVHMALSYQGTYNLVIFSNHDGRDNVLSTCASFLITNTSNQRASFFVDPRSWGMYSQDHPVQCVDNCGSTIHAPRGEGSITFTIPKDHGKETQFRFQSPGKRGTWKEVAGFCKWIFGEYIDSDYDRRTVKFNFRTPRKGFFKFILFFGGKFVGRWLISCPRAFEGNLFPESEGLWGADCKMTEELKIKCSHPARFNAVDGNADFTVTVPRDMSEWHVVASLHDTAGPKLMMKQQDVCGDDYSREGGKVYTFHIALPESVSMAILSVNLGKQKHSGQKVMKTQQHGQWLVTATNT